MIQRFVSFPAVYVAFGLYVAKHPDPDWPLDRCGFEMVVGCERHRATLEAFSGTYVHHPLEDGRELPALTDLEVVARAGAQVLREGGRVLVHCTEGKNRSGLVAAMILRQLVRCSGMVARDHLRAAVPGSLYNRHFYAWLGELPAPTPIEVRALLSSRALSP